MRGGEGEPEPDRRPNDGTGGGAYDDNDGERRVLLGRRRAVHHDRRGGLPQRRDRVAAATRARARPRGASTGPRSAALGDITLAVVPNGLPPPTSAATARPSPRPPTACSNQMRGQGYPAAVPAARRRLHLGLERPDRSTTPSCWRWPTTSPAPSTATGVSRRWTTCWAATRWASPTSPATASKPSRNPHHRFWANQLDPSLPTRRPARWPAARTAGCRTRSPQQRLRGCRPQKCFVDDIEA